MQKTLLLKINATLVLKIMPQVASSLAYIMVMSKLSLELPYAAAGCYCAFQSQVLSRNQALHVPNHEFIIKAVFTVQASYGDKMMQVQP